MSAEKRMIHSQLFEDDYMGSLPLQDRYLWIGIICTCADDQGRLANIPAVIRSKVFPYDDIRLADIAAALDKFAADGKLRAYVASGRPLLQVVNWWRYQQPAWAEPSAYPAPDGWMDRVRCNMRGGGQKSENWDQPGGYERAAVKASAKQAELGLPETAPAADPVLVEEQRTPQLNQVRTPQRTQVDTPQLTPQRTQVDMGIVKLSKDIDKLSLSQDIEKQKDMRAGDPHLASGETAPAMPAAAAENNQVVYPRTPKEAKMQPEIRLFEKITGKLPGVNQYVMVIDSICLLRLDFPAESDLERHLRKFANAWRARKNERGQGYDILHLPWLTEWAINDLIPGERSKAAVEVTGNKFLSGKFAEFVEH